MNDLTIDREKVLLYDAELVEIENIPAEIETIRQNMVKWLQQNPHVWACDECVWAARYLAQTRNLKIWKDYFRISISQEDWTEFATAYKYSSHYAEIYWRKAENEWLNAITEQEAEYARLQKICARIGTAEQQFLFHSIEALREELNKSKTWSAKIKSLEKISQGWEDELKEAKKREASGYNDVF